MKTSRKKPLSTSVDTAIYERIALLAQVDSRSIAEIAAMCAQAGLPLVEAAIEQHVRIQVTRAADGQLSASCPGKPDVALWPLAPATPSAPARAQEKPKRKPAGGGARFEILEA